MIRANVRRYFFDSGEYEDSKFEEISEWCLGALPRLRKNQANVMIWVNVRRYFFDSGECDDSQKSGECEENDITF